MKWRDETTGQPKLWFKTTAQIAFGLILVVPLISMKLEGDRKREREEAARQQQKAEPTPQEKAAQRQDEQERVAILQKMTITTDKVEQIDWYRDKSSGGANDFFLSCGKRPSGKPWLRLKIAYNAHDWLFINAFTIVADGVRYDRDQARFARDSGSGWIHEAYDENLSENELGMMWTIIPSKEAVVRLRGDHKVFDVEITKAQKVALQNVIEACEVLGGH